MNIQDISFRIDWLDLLPVQGTLKSFLPTPQFKSINSLALSFLYSLTLTSIHDYWKTIPLTRWTFVDKVMSLLFNMLSRLVIIFQLLAPGNQSSILYFYEFNLVFICLFKIPCISDTIQYLFFFAWFISLSLPGSTILSE